VKTMLLALAFVSVPAVAQDAARGRLLYETQCGDCHYERVHERPPGRTSVQMLADLRDQVARRAAQTRRPFTLEDLAAIAEYLDQSHYRLKR